MTARRRIQLAAMLGTVVLLLSGCGVPTEQTPRPLAVASSPSRTATPTAPNSTGPDAPSERLYLIEDGALVAVERRVDQPPTADAVLAALLAGPNDSERADGLSSALLGSDVTGDVHLDGGIATLELAADLNDARTDEILAYGQLVCTLTALAEVTAVQFTRNGGPVGIPRADGSLAATPLSAADYAALLASATPAGTPSSAHS